MLQSVQKSCFCSDPFFQDGKLDERIPDERPRCGSPEAVRHCGIALNEEDSGPAPAEMCKLLARINCKSKKLRVSCLFFSGSREEDA